MKSIAHQSVLDLAIQLHGSPLSALDLAIANGFSITQDVEPGIEIDLGDTAYGDREVRDYFSGRKMLIATAPLTVSDDGYELPGELPMSL